jgi:hypothetical protein
VTTIDAPEGLIMSHVYMPFGAAFVDESFVPRFHDTTVFKQLAATNKSISA